MQVIFQSKQDKNAPCNYLCTFHEHPIQGPWGLNSGNPSTHRFIGSCNCMKCRKYKFKKCNHYLPKDKGYYNYTTLKLCKLYLKHETKKAWFCIALCLCCPASFKFQLKLPFARHSVTCESTYSIV